MSNEQNEAYEPGEPTPYEKREQVFMAIDGTINLITNVLRKFEAASEASGEPIDREPPIVLRNRLLKLRERFEADEIDRVECYDAVTQVLREALALSKREKAERKHPEE
jgi:hypothetical protein